MSLRFPEAGSVAFTPVVVFAAVLGQRLFLALAMAPFVADVVWTLLMALGALGYACAAAAAAALVDVSSRRLGATLRFGVRVFGGMFVVATYSVSFLIDVVFGFLPHILFITGPLLLISAVLGIGCGLLTGVAVQLGDALLRRLRTIGV